MRFGTLAVVAIATGLAACGQRPPPEIEAATRGTAAAGAARCEDIAARTFPNTTIAAATVVPAGTFAPPAAGAFPPPAVEYGKLPAFCRVTGSIKPSADSDIRFEVWLPEAGWNGRFMQTGNGGAAGSIVVASLAEPLARGYAVANTDTGHQGAGGDFAWAVEHPERLVDYQYRAVHELTVVGKAITAARYGAAPEKSYWNGCSTGGRQGLKEAQRFPDDYDAIVAGAPANNWSLLMSLSISIQRNLGPGGLGADKLALLKDGAIAACDVIDGVRDRVISEPAQCTFDPASLGCGSAASAQCLAPSEIAAAKRIYGGVVNAAGETLFPGTGVASEPLWAAYASPQFAIGTNYFRHVVANDPTWDPASFDPAADLARAERIDAGAANAMDPDLSAFAARGGKLILYHGTTDGLIPYGNTVSYYDDVVAALGPDRADEHVRLYLVPGMDHCAGGEGAFVADWLGAMESWVERGEEPGALPAAHPAAVPGPPGAPAASSTPFTRPLCVYPQVAHYKGGDETAAASFECAAPSQ
jgi:feruloyl esterase